jgi:hypothetical protein
MAEGGEGPKIPHIEWKGSKSPEQVADLNKASPAGAEFLQRGESNRNALLAGIDRGLINITRVKCLAIISDTKKGDLAEADTRIDAVIRGTHPKEMISILHGVNEIIRVTDPVRYAAMAEAFLSLTDNY